jgi:hypothetical protein
VTKRRGQGRIDDYANSLPDKEPKESREVIARWYLKIMNRTILTDVLSAALTSLGISYEAEDSIAVLRRRLLEVPGLPFTLDTRVAPGISPWVKENMDRKGQAETLKKESIKAEKEKRSKETPLDIDGYFLLSKFI